MSYTDTLDWLKGQAEVIIRSLLTPTYDDWPLVMNLASREEEMPLARDGRMDGAGAYFAEYEWDWQDFPSGFLDVTDRWKKVFTGTYTDNGSETPDFGFIQILTGEHEGRPLVIWLWQRDDACTRHNAWGEIGIYVLDSAERQDRAIDLLKSKAARLILPEKIPHPNEVQLLEALGVDVLRPLAQVMAEVHRG